MKNAFSNLSNELKAEKAVKLAVLDILSAKPTATAGEVAAYMGSTSFENSVKRYIQMMNEA